MGLSGEVALAAAKKYTDLSVEGAGAIKGKNCAIQSIEPITGGNQVTFAWYDDDDQTLLTSAMNVMNGTNLPHYTTMPSDSAILAMANNTVFETDGYYSRTDGHGGKYAVLGSQSDNTLPITDGTTTKYLAALDNNGNKLTDYVDPTRYGVRPITNIKGTLTVAGTHAAENSAIMSKIVSGYFNSTIRFPRGNYVFQDPLNLTSRQFNLIGENQPVCRTAALSNNGYDIGTLLCFPFLTDGQTAISLNQGNIENIAVYGYMNTYNFVIDRSKLTTAPDQVITETIAESEGSPVKCTAISSAGIGWVKNVYVFCFYTGVTCSGSTYIQDFYARKTHYGIKAGNDTKIEGAFGYDTHTPVSITGSLCSVLHERVDSCVHALEILNGFSHTITDIDGDWCTDSLIAIGDGVTSGTVGSTIFQGIHGRCNTLKAYDSTQHPDPVDVRTLEDTAGYGIIRVYAKANFTDSIIVLNNHGGARPTDGASNLLTPDILLAFPLDFVGSIDKLTFVLAKGIYDKDDILRVVQTRANFTAKIEDASGVYFIDEETVSSYGLLTTPLTIGETTVTTVEDAIVALAGLIS